MPINPDAVGSKSEPQEHRWTSKDALIYALGVGAGAVDPLTELEFTTENTADTPQQVLPTMAVVLGAGGFAAMGKIGSFNPAMLVHGEQAFEVFSPIPVEGTVSTVGEVVGIYDKGKGAVVVSEAVSTDVATGQKLFTNRSSAFIRGEGGWGGDRGPSGPQNVPPEREPDRSLTFQTRSDQALIYRLSGDRNPLHSDPSFAAMGGFDRPILHGLCTYGFTGRALLHALCEGDPTRFRSMEGRFSSPVFPGEALTINMWVDGDAAVFQTTGRGRPRRPRRRPLHLHLVAGAGDRGQASGSSAASTSAMIWSVGGMPGVSRNSAGCSPSAISCQRWTHSSTKSGWGKTQKRSPSTASATRSATAAGVVPSSMARRTYLSMISLPSAALGVAPWSVGQLRSASRMPVRTQPGHSTLTPTPLPLIWVSR